MEQLNSESVGTIEYGVQYFSESQKLVVDLLRAFDLQLKDSIQADTYCKCTLMPEKISFRTKIVKRNTNPIYEEKFEFVNVELSRLESRYLEISLFELDKLSNDECLGSTYLNLNAGSIENKKMFLKDLKTSFKTDEV